MKYVIKDLECGYLLKNGKFVKLLTAGKYKYLKAMGYEVKLSEMKGEVNTCGIPLEILMQDEGFVKRTVRLQITDDSIAIHFVNGCCKNAVISGDTAYWNVFEKNEFQMIDITSPYMEEKIAKLYINCITANFYRRFTVGEGEAGLLYFDGRFQEELTEGIYYFWNFTTNITCQIVDKKIQHLEINGQEILTADKVSVRLNIVCSYRITEPVLMVQNIKDLQNQLYTYVQLAAREYIGQFKLDELLAQKNTIGSVLYEKLIEKQKEFYVEFHSCGVKDVILPGEIREIMNTVLVAEKRAQANVITRREEVASTRSLLNTAKLMEENKTLYKLKEMECLERVCDRVGNISISNGTQILGQLQALLNDS